MAFYDNVFTSVGLSDWCKSESEGNLLTMSDFMSKSGQNEVSKIEGTSFWDIPFPSLDALNASCPAIARTRDMTSGLEDFFLATKDAIKFVLDPMTQPLSWALDASLEIFVAMPWFVLIPALAVFAFYVARSIAIVGLVLATFMFFAFIDHYLHAVQTLSIITVCTVICVVIGLPLGVLMSKSNVFKKTMIPILDMLQTLPAFVYLVPLIFLFSVTESKLYGIAIILYAIVPIMRLTDLGIRLVDKDVIEAADAYGMNSRQKLINVQLPLAMPNIMAGLNQTIMMALSLVVIASLVSAPGLGVLVLRGIRNLELGVGLVAGFCIVMLAILLDRVSKAALSRINTTQN
ncbi:ABC transporter permease subunit [Amylibacter sp. SFDW26]|uniref:ABC transporter permease n=1 Tax=Amylibacter sp. SFDW26 TaxID=2652722 RepID=UPI001262A1FA|nr:ABC transporter permease subunit [Amylibacter sp. SFDW26]KAB7610268.1 ABC transporter permease subunit [Amylibacter sp. SFDW26]